MAITVQDLIQQSYMAGVKIICGKSRLSTRIEGLTFFNDACSNSISKRNVVLAAAGELNQYTSSGLEQIGKTFSNQKIAALVIKMDKKYDSILEKNLADIFASCSFTVLTLPNDVLIASLIKGLNYDIIYAQGYNMSNPYEDNCLQELVCVERNEQCILSYIKMMGIRVNEYLCILLLKPTGKVDLRDITRICYSFLGNEGFISRRNGTVMLMLRSTAEYTDAVAYFRNFSENLRSHMKNVYQKDFFLGVGHTFENQIEIRKSYLSAKTALLAALASTGKDIIFYDDMGIYKILYHLRNRKDLFELKNDTVDRLKTYDLDHHTEYYQTIKSYVQNFYSIRNTANQLFVQYNTIRYRIAKIKEEFGWDLFDRDDCIYLTIGFQAENFLQEEKAN